MKIFNRGQKNKRGKKVRLPLSVYVTYLLIVTLIFTGVSFSKYATVASSEASARVAGFNVSIDKDEIFETEKELVLEFISATETQSTSCEFTVASDSEVFSTDTVTITLPVELPKGISMSMIVNEEEVEIEEIDQKDEEKTETKKYTCSKIFEPGDVSHKWVLTFTGDPQEFDQNETEKTLSDINIHVDVIQIDERN